MNSFYDLSVKTPNGKILNMSDYKGKTVLVVNTATRCGLTPQFAGLEELHQKYKDQGLVIVGFPCNQFGKQEPESNENMEQVCEINHGVTFQLTEKVEVNGAGTHPVFKYLKGKLGSILGSKIKWNFTKFLIDKKGRPMKRFASITTPESMEKYILKEL